MAKRPVGRPPMYRLPFYMIQRIEKYFKDEIYCRPFLDKDKKPCTNTAGKIIWDIKPPTVAGLALYLGFADRSSLYEYKARPDFAYAIKRAVTEIECFAEEQLHLSSSTGAIFWLKNHGWTDKTKLEHSGSDGGPLTFTVIKKMETETKKD